MTCRELISKIFTHPHYTGCHDINLFRRYRRKELEEFLSALDGGEAPSTVDIESAADISRLAEIQKTNN